MRLIYLQLPCHGASLNSLLYWLRFNKFNTFKKFNKFHKFNQFNKFNKFNKEMSVGWRTMRGENGTVIHLTDTSIKNACIQMCLCISVTVCRYRTQSQTVKPYRPSQMESNSNTTKYWRTTFVNNSLVLKARLLLSKPPIPSTSTDKTYLVPGTRSRNVCCWELLGTMVSWFGVRLPGSPILNW